MQARCCPGKDVELLATLCWAPSLYKTELQILRTKNAMLINRLVPFLSQATGRSFPIWWERLQLSSVISKLTGMHEAIWIHETLEWATGAVLKLSLSRFLNQIPTPVAAREVLSKRFSPWKTLRSSLIISFTHSVRRMRFNVDQWTWC
jgi:hypothetical protein